MTRWTYEAAPDQTGRTVIVTGANSGIGLETARQLALRGAEVVLACRRLEKGQAALGRIRREQPAANVTLALLDLANLDSVAAFARRFSDSHRRLDLLINNAGVMAPPFSRTAQGFELQLGTNHLGHFALTAQLWHLLARTPESRLVVVSSVAAHHGCIDFNDLNFERRAYRPWVAYCQSKLANSLFALELARRAGASRSYVAVTAAHPGWTATDLQRNTGVARLVSPWFAMKPEDGALPTLRAAVDPRVGNGSYWGPSRMFELNGPPVPAKIPRRARDAADAERLWYESERLTGVGFALAPVMRLREAV